MRSVSLLLFARESTAETATPVDGVPVTRLVEIFLRERRGEREGRKEGREKGREGGGREG